MNEDEIRITAKDIILKPFSMDAENVKERQTLIDSSNDTDKLKAHGN